MEKLKRFEYLTCEEILPFNKKQITEQAKFNYSPLGKAFEEQTKIIKKQRKALENQGEKQIKVIKNQGQVKTIKKINKDNTLISKQKGILD